MDAKEAMARAWEMRVSLMRVALSVLRHTADAEDAVSRAILTAGSAIASLRDERRFNAWLMRILVRCCCDTLRHRKRETSLEDARESLETREHPAFDAPAGALWEAIGTLPSIYARVLVLYYYDGFKAREIASILGVPLGTVVGRLARGRAKLKQIWTAEEADHEQPNL